MSQEADVILEEDFAMDTVCCAPLVCSHRTMPVRGAYALWIYDLFTLRNAEHRSIEARYRYVVLVLQPRTYIYTWYTTTI